MTAREWLNSVSSVIGMSALTHLRSLKKPIPTTLMTEHIIVLNSKPVELVDKDDIIRLKEVDTVIGISTEHTTKLDMEKANGLREDH